jgi:hypothetical protein
VGEVPISIVTLVDRDRIWFKSKQGVDVEEIGREPGLCASEPGTAAILGLFVRLIVRHVRSLTLRFSICPNWPHS